MPVMLRLRDIPQTLEACLREAVDTALEGDWCVTASRSHLDGQYYLQLDGIAVRCRVALPQLTETSGDDLARLLQRLVRVAYPGTVPTANLASITTT
jgi:hypothetical protein